LIERFLANIDTRVPASVGLARKLGMRLEVTFKEGEFFKGAWCDMWLYAILKSKFKNQF
jgi:aminoglycoside 6'-N-acetyltransferase